MSDVKFRVFADREQNRVAVVIRIGDRVFDLPLNPKSARRFVERMNEALDALEN